MDKHRLLGGLLAAGFVMLWGSPHLLTVLFSEPPPTRRRAIHEALNSLVSMGLAGLMGWLTFDWGAGFINALVAKWVGVSPGIPPSVAGIVVAVMVTQWGPGLIKLGERLMSKKASEVTS